MYVIVLSNRHTLFLSQYTSTQEICLNIKFSGRINLHSSFSKVGKLGKRLYPQTGLLNVKYNVSSEFVATVVDNTTVSTMKFSAWKI